MIKVLVGGIGSGKSLTLAKWIVNSDDKVFTNFKVRSKNVTRLKNKHLFKEVVKGKTKKLGVNWQFWNDQVRKHKGFSIAIDELHNVMHSRRAMSTQNVLLSKWVSQIRKLTGESESCDLVLITQVLQRADVSVRDLINQVVHCTKTVGDELVPTTVYRWGKKTVLDLPKTFITLTYFTGSDCKERYYSWLSSGNIKAYDKRVAYVGNPFFKFFDSHEIISFGDSEYL